MALAALVPTALLSRLGIAGLLLACAWLHGCHHGGRDARAELDQEQRDHRATKGFYAQLIKDYAARAADVARLARAASDAVRRERAELDARHQEELTHAKTEADRLRADLRTGRQQLRDWWTCDLPGAPAGDAAADRAQAHAASRADSATRIVESADVDAAVIGWLWGAWQADRRAVIDAGCAVEATP